MYVCRIATGTTRRIDRILELVVSGWTGLWNPNGWYGTLFSGFTGSLSIVAMFAHFFTFVENWQRRPEMKIALLFSWLSNYRITAP